jgi:hypothetical protein
MALYSASILDRETVPYLRALYDIILDPRKTVNPPVECLSSISSAQSASEKPLTSVDLDFRIFKPRLMLDLIYGKIRLTVAQCMVVGDCKN